MPDNTFKKVASVYLARYSHNLITQDSQEALSGKLRGDDEEASTSRAILDTIGTLIESFSEKDRRFEGIYRVNGNERLQTSTVDHLPHLFPELRPGTVAAMKPVDKAGCIKKLLARLPDSLFPSCQRRALLNVAAMIPSSNVPPSTKERVKKAVQILIYFQQSDYKRCLKKLLQHLVDVAEQEAHNRMGIGNLAIALSPTLFPTSKELQKEVKEVGIYSRLLPILLESLPELFELPEEVIASLEKSVENHERKFQASEASSHLSTRTPSKGEAGEELDDSVEVMMAERYTDASTPTKPTTDEATAGLLEVIKAMPPSKRKDELLARHRKMQSNEMTPTASGKKRTLFPLFGSNKKKK